MSKKKLTKEDILNDESLSPQEKYHKYLKTEEWKSLKKIILERDNYRCLCCGRTNDEKNSNLTIHHSTYEHIFDESNHMEDLITLCRYCHYSIHRCKSNMYRFKIKEIKEVKD